MKYQLSFGHIAERIAPVQRKKFRIAFLADLSGRANRGEVRSGADLAASSGMRVDVDNIDDVLQRQNLTLELQLGDANQGVEMKFASMDDFHPDDFYENLDFFSELSSLRRRLKNTSTFEKAATEVMSWDRADSSPSRVRHSGSNSVPRAKFSDFADLMGRHTERRDFSATSVDELVRHIVAPHIVPQADPRQEELVRIVDESLSTAMRQILHHPDFQAAESTWRSIDLLTRRLETDSSLEIILFDISAEELAADLSSTADLTKTGLYSLLVEQPSASPAEDSFTLVVGNYVFDPIPPHADLLSRIAQIAAAAGAPFLAGLSCNGIEHFVGEENELASSAWESLMALPHSAYLGLVSPRFLLRWPYGSKTEPIDPFAFEEFTPQRGFGGMLWGNGAVLAGLCLGQAFVRTGSFQEILTGPFVVGDLPYYCFEDKHGDVVALPCGERWITESKAMQLSSLGCIPLVSFKGRDEVRLGKMVSVAGSDLAGAWNPLEIAPVEPPAAEPPAETTETPPVIERSAEQAETAVAESDDAAPDNSEEISQEVDSLLAGLEESSATSTEAGDDDDEMDPELAALLAEL